MTPVSHPDANASVPPPPPADSEAIRQLLLAERDRTLSSIVDADRELANLVAAAAASNGDDEHDPEGTTIAFEREQLAALRAQELTHLADLDAAVRRLADGTFGLCTTCGQAIDPARLEARPQASECVSCAGRRSR
jgi:RNA polymerase-binding transcription factor